MKYEVLELSYWLKQIDRVEDIRQKINDQGNSSTPGKVVPEQEDLVLGTGKRINMAVMFLDICNFSSRPANSSQEQQVLLNTMNFFFTEMVRIAEDYGGTVEKNTGDGLMVYFEEAGGEPAEEGTKRAVACSLTMFYSTNNLINPVLKLSNIKEIEFRLTIDYGPVTVARLGAPRRFNAVVAVGSTANIASKMLEHAQPNDILLGGDAYNRLPQYWKNNWVCFLTATTGFIYSLSNQPYCFYKYTGRWVGPK